MSEILFAHQWPIPENRLLPLKDSENGYLCSTRVTKIPGFEYYLKIYPNGYKDGCRGETWVSLILKLKNVKQVKADYTYSIECVNYVRTGHSVYEESSGWGYRICTTNEFYDPEKKFIVNGKCTIKVNGIFKFEIENGTIPAAIGDGKQNWIGGELGDEFWKRNDTKDFTIITADGNEIKIHKCVLDIRSDVFTAMLKSNMKESTENKVTINDFSFNVVETALKLIYECNFKSSLSMNELMELLQFFDKYLLQTLKAKVEPYLVSQISASTVVDLTNCSIKTNSIKLKEKCIEFLSAAFAAKIPLSDFDDLDKDIAFKILKNAFHGTLETEE